jgi:beta-aspartyl-peptidase (threonine type)
MTVSIVVHGGAWDIPDDLVEAHELACKAALLEGWGILASGGHALDAVETAIRVMEDDPHLNAGTGSVLNAEGKVQLDASIMEGAGLSAGAVAAVEGLKNPISLARRVLESENVFLVAEGALLFAKATGMELCSEEELVVERELRLWQEWRESRAAAEGEASSYAVGDTVGAVAMDERGNIAAGDSTGGRPFKHPGRVGDSPLIGCGVYADNGLGGAACTGQGESITRVVLARTALEFVRNGSPAQEAAKLAIRLLGDKVDGRGGVILIDPRGEVGFAFSTEALAHAYLMEGMQDPVVSVGRARTR